MDVKLSSRMTISDAPCATLVPVRPIDKPTSAAFSAGASFVPSPVCEIPSSCSGILYLYYLFFVPVTPTTSPPPGRVNSHSCRYPGSKKSFLLSQVIPANIIVTRRQFIRRKLNH